MLLLLPPEIETDLILHVGSLRAPKKKQEKTNIKDHLMGIQKLHSKNVAPISTLYQIKIINKCSEVVVCSTVIQGHNEAKSKY